MNKFGQGTRDRCEAKLPPSDSFSTSIALGAIVQVRIEEQGKGIPSITVMPFTSHPAEDNFDEALFTKQMAEAEAAPSA